MGLMFKHFPTGKSKRLLGMLLSTVLVITNVSVGQLPVLAQGEGEKQDVSGNDASGGDVSDNQLPAYDSSKIDVWDFGAEVLDVDTYNNMLTPAIMNAWYPGVDPGTTGKNLASFTVGDLAFQDGGYATTHRLRTTNTAITRYDGKSLTGEDGTVYNGYIYSNKGSNADVNVSLQVSAGEILTLVVGSNGNLSTINMVNPNGVIEAAQDFDLGGGKAKVMTFYPTETGTYRFYSSNEKLVVARLYRERTSLVTVSGKVTDPAELSGYSLLFTDDDNGSETAAAVDGTGSYSAQLYNNHEYTVSLLNANGYIITSGASLSLAKGVGNTTHDVTVTGVSLIAAEGKITGLPAQLLAKLKLTFADQDEEAIYSPITTLTSDTYAVSLQTDHTYDIVSDGQLTSQVNDSGNGNKVVMGLKDYQLADLSAIEAGTTAITRNLAYELKPYYGVTIAPTGAALADLAAATFTFTNLEEEGYVYSFIGTDNIALRDGTYSVSVSNSGRFVQELTSNLKVNGAAVTKNISFNGNVTLWDFTAADFTGSSPYNGLTFTNGKKHSAGLQIKDGTISVPVSGSCRIAVTGCYDFEYYFGDNVNDLKVDTTSTGSTAKFDTITYDYAGEAGTVDIHVTNTTTSYLTKIEISSILPYDASLTVGATGCDYTSINDALAAVRKMDRTATQRVTISIQPGNYEEMLVIDVPNVTLENASAAPSTALSNKGVDIDANAVRITSYYGHGYTYYSMGKDCKWNADILAVNKENGYESFTNPGTGTTSGSYWNATVVVTASGFQANGIIFENSFNQYVSAKAADDVIVPLAGAKEPTSAPRAGLSEGSTAVQDKAYVERAAALAIANSCVQVSFDNCKFIGRQDTLYGGTDVTAAFYDCAIYGGTDYIFGPMTAVFAKCDLVFNTSEDKNDVGYITAPQQKSGRGYLLYNCHITSTIPGVDTASAYTSKPGYLGRPWQSATGEAVFYDTVIDATCSEYFADAPSMIAPLGWLNTLSGESALCLEYGTYEYAKDTDNTASRAAWSGGVLAEPKLADGKDINAATFLGDWDAFAGKDMTVALPTEKVDNTPVVEGVIETHIFDPTTIDATGIADKTVIAEGTTYDSGYFKVVGKITQRVPSGQTTSVELDKAENGKLQFTITGTADVELQMASTGSSNTSPAALKDAEGNVISNAEGLTTVTTTSPTTLTYKGLAAGTYSIVSPLDASYNRGARILYVEVKETTSGEKPARADWSTVSAPSALSVLVQSSTIAVSFNALIGYDGADKVMVSMYQGDTVVDTISYATEGTSGTVTFTPETSGTYSFDATAVREGETDKVSEKVTAASAFILPLETPYVSSVTSIGGGSVDVVWTAVPEADSYEVSAVGTDIKVTTTQLHAVLEGLTIGTEYTFSVVALRGEDRSQAGTKKATVSADKQQVWSFSAFGDGVNTTTNGSEGDANTGSVRVYSTGGKGKLVPATRDGLAFYYTQLDADADNFILKATAKVNTWKYSNGQEGFGLMAADAVGTHGDSTSFWNNSYMTSVTKVEYFWDSSKNAVSDTGSKISMKLGVGAQEKIGATGPSTDVANFSSTMTTLDTSCAIGGAGTYNLVGNYENNPAPEGTIGEPYTTFELTLQRDNTGYRLSYTDPDGNTVTKLYYDIERDNLSAIDSDSVYVGFFASRNADVTFDNISLTISDAATDAPAEDREITKVTPVYQVTSAETANSSSYDLIYRGNADGTLTIADQGGNVLTNTPVSANTDYVQNVTLAKGTNTFTITMVPDTSYKPSEYSVMANYDTKTFTHKVTYQTIDKTYIYVAPNGTSTGTGSKESPVDIYTAVKYAAPGQTILLAGGTYALSSTVVVDRGIDGTQASPITMAADPEATKRPIFDFGGKCPGMVLAGNYWIFKGFDVTRSANAQKGIQVSGSYNTLDQIKTYHNGNSGVQISRYLSTDEWDNWPSHNLILNCTSYGNADQGYEDADGFAAKLTIGDGNVFDGCIAYNNADDGWDLFAKIESGPIGKVVIKNSVAYGNGYLEDGTNAGNGNGFKMGGSSISGYHTLINSVAFNNKAKGIDSNSCPDIQIQNCTTFNNESYNVAFYTSGAANTDFAASGLLSYRTKFTDVKEQLSPKGTQDETKIYGTTNYYWDTDSVSSKNSAGAAVAADWFKSLDFTNISRNADGTINMNGFLELTAAAPGDTGARMSGTASEDIVVDPNADKEEPTPSNPDDGGNTDEGNTDSGNTDEGNKDEGNTDEGNKDEGNTDSGNTDNSNTDSGNTDNSNTDSGNTDNNNTNNSNTDNNNTNNSSTDDTTKTKQEEKQVAELQELVNELESISKNATPAQKAEAAAKMIKNLPASALKNLSVESTTSLKLLKKAEEEIAALLGTKVEVVAGSNTAPNLNVTNVEVINALLSVPTGQNAEIKVSAPNGDIPDQVGSKFLVGAFAFDLKLFVNNVQTPLTAPVLIRIPIPAGIDTSKEIIVLHMKDDGQTEELKVKITDGYLEFVTSSFSTFVAANLDTQKPATLASQITSPVTYDNSAFEPQVVLPTKTQSTKKDNFLWIILLLLAVSCGAVTAGIKFYDLGKKRKK
jgi:pectin methylesterase-like acyl-CoA thioesterase